MRPEPTYEVRVENNSVLIKNKTRKDSALQICIYNISYAFCELAI
jgi:hypothetical protein